MQDDARENRQISYDADPSERLRPAVNNVRRTRPRDEQASEVQPRQLIVTLYGLYARTEDNWLSIASTVRLMSDLGIDEQAVRSSISRLKRRDILRSVRFDGVAGYALSPATLDMLREGDARIFSRTRAQLGDPWVMVVFSVPESERERRHDLRVQLTRLGFGTVAPGVWVAPDHLVREVRQVLARRELDDYVDLFSGVYLGFKGLVGRVRQWWDLDALSARYDDFVATYQPLVRRIGEQLPDERESFRDFVMMLTQWRQLPYLDPGLPLELLPKRWSGETAEQIFDTIDYNLRDRARDYVTQTLKIRQGV